MRRRFAGIVVALIVLGATAVAQTLTFPALTGRVVDEAGLLDAAARAQLDQTLADLEIKTTDQLVVVTLKSLQGTSIEDYGYQLGRHWRIGQRDKNNGALLIVAPGERKVRIEVGYGLEGTLTDAISNFIVQNSILPRFKAGDFAGGIKRGVEDIVQVLSGDAEEYRQRAGKSVEREMTVEEAIVIAFFLFIATMIILNVVAGVLQGASGNRRRGRRGHWGDSIPIIIGPSSGGGWSSGGSSSGGGFSGGGGSFGGGGSSGSW
jgi:uncharacterized protein